MAGSVETISVCNSMLLLCWHGDPHDAGPAGVCSEYRVDDVVGCASPPQCAWGLHCPGACALQHTCMQTHMHVNCIQPTSRFVNAGKHANLLGHLCFTKHVYYVRRCSVQAYLLGHQRHLPCNRQPWQWPGTGPGWWQDQLGSCR
jgi:hypothetical protein